MKNHKPPFNKTFVEVMSKRKITDLTLKMQAIKKIPQDKLTALFFEMSDLGINLYIQSEREKKTRRSKMEIIREYYQKRIESSMRR